MQKVSLKSLKENLATLLLLITNYGWPRKLYFDSLQMWLWTKINFSHDIPLRNNESWHKSNVKTFLYILSQTLSQLQLLQQFIHALSYPQLLLFSQEQIKKASSSHLVARVNPWHYLFCMQNCCCDFYIYGSFSM